MYPALIGKKVGMTQVFDAKGAVQPVTADFAKLSHSLYEAYAHHVVGF